MPGTPTSPMPFAEVVHVDVASSAPARLRGSTSGRALVVLWSEDRPVGQLRLAPGDDPLSAVAAWAPARSPKPAAARTPPAPRTATVVICTRDRPHELARCLAGLPQQSRPPDEVVVVDNASAGLETRDVALAAGAHYIREDRPGLDIARNAGLLAARSDVVAYTDDDTELHPQWLARLLAAFDADEVMAVTGLVLPAALDTEAQWLFQDGWGFGRGFVRTDFGPEFYRASRPRGCPTWEFGAGANMAFRRTVRDAVGLFDERLDVGAAGCSGDSEYWYRIVAAGWTCRYEPSAVVFHHHRTQLAGLRRQIFHYMRGHVAALLVQYERTRDLGNLRRAFVTVPLYYARRVVALVVRGRRPGDLVLLHEVLGAGAGLPYYLWARYVRRMRAAPARSATAIPHRSTRSRPLDRHQARR
jgi:glycosyltransferase involved in cell wall biosynthesis